ncbi:HAD family hydrolase [Microcoleus sp. A2-C5]|uniref:HAD family hydrolase n=1 Tax=Microcoleaceae TaxID=1892252 RepID=UPI002238DE8E|nr:HAD family hydrolase [Lyngbya sp. CCAP 1446/10]MCW6051143.1 HAD family hydrolase [Lyngbya sp. CCAP 1446/10]
MTNNFPTILALDFDGVICDGLIEYFQTAWRSYCQIWKPVETVPDPDLALSFYRVRPAIETGWEMPLLIRALVTGITEEQILLDWPNIVPHLLTENNLKAQSVGAMLDGLRDNWIAEDLAGWLSLHRFYPGVADRLKSLLQESSVKVAIVTTKEGRFVRELLQLAGVQMPSELIFGKEYNKPKHQILREFLATSGKDTTIWFVEDRLKTLLSVKQQPDLSQVKLFLADWGYNTLAERQSVAQNPPVQLLSLSQFAGDFADWLPDKD